MAYARLVSAGMVLLLAVLGATWLAGYRVDVLVANHRNPRLLDYSVQRVHAPAWWTAWAAAILLFAGATLAVRILGGRIRPVHRISDYFGRTSARVGLRS